jgi:hypothetical protein
VKTQLTAPIDNSALLDKAGNLRLQHITGKFQYYSRAVDPTMNVALSTLASQQMCGTKLTEHDSNKFLNNCATHSDASIRYQASDMILKVHSEASYNSKPKAHSRVGGHFYMGNRDSTSEEKQGTVLASTAIMNAVLASASEAEIGALYENTRKASILCTTLDNPVQTNNSTACSIANNSIKQQRSRAIDMRWVCDRVQQQQFHIYWAPGKHNLADYYTKHHSATHHQQMRELYLHSTPSTNAINSVIAKALHVLQGCAKPTLGSTTVPRSRQPERTNPVRQHAGRAVRQHQKRCGHVHARRQMQHQQACRVIPAL